MAHDACVASATVADGSPARPNTTRRPVSSCTATIHSGSAGHRSPNSACNGSAMWSVGCLPRRQDGGGERAGAHRPRRPHRPGAAGPATPSCPADRCAPWHEAGVQEATPLGAPRQLLPVTAVRQRRGEGDRRPACQLAASTPRSNRPTCRRRGRPAGHPSPARRRSPPARRRGRRDRRCRRRPGRRRPSGRPWRPVCPTRRPSATHGCETACGGRGDDDELERRRPHHDCWSPSWPTRACWRTRPTPSATSSSCCQARAS